MLAMQQWVLLPARMTQNKACKLKGFLLTESGLVIMIVVRVEAGNYGFRGFRYSLKLLGL